jgi:NAD(P)-dependent dehydrogenase (short-subunit alcohol dehydrogenase family)
VADRFDMSGKVVLITGGSRGLGFEMAKAFTDAGGAVIISSRKADACERAAQELRKAGQRVAVVPAHAGKWDDATALAAEAWAAFGRIDVLINNAGIAPVAPTSADISEELFDKTIGVNLKGPFRLTALLAPRMRENGGGAVINVSSIAAVTKGSDYPVYAAAKAGLNALTRAHAHEYGPNVRVNAIMCGPFRTDIAAAWADDVDRTTKAAARRIGRPDEVVTAALYLASDSSSFSTGSVVTVDGGVL